MTPAQHVAGQPWPIIALSQEAPQLPPPWETQSHGCIIDQLTSLHQCRVMAQNPMCRQIQPHTIPMQAFGSSFYPHLVRLGQSVIHCASDHSAHDSRVQGDITQALPMSELPTLVAVVRALSHDVLHSTLGVTYMPTTPALPIFPPRADLPANFTLPQHLHGSLTTKPQLALHHRYKWLS